MQTPCPMAQDWIDPDLLWRSAVTLPNLFDHELELFWQSQLKTDRPLTRFSPFLVQGSRPQNLQNQASLLLHLLDEVETAYCWCCPSQLCRH